MRMRSNAKREINEEKRILLCISSTSSSLSSSVSRSVKLKAATKRLGTLKYLTTTTNASPLQDMSCDFFVLMARDWLDWKDGTRLDSAMCFREGRVALLEALRSGVVIYEGSKGEKDTLSVECLRWLSLRGVGLRYLSVALDVPSSLAFAVARNSPTLKCLHVNYDVDNGMYLEQLEAKCPMLEEVRLRGTGVESCVDQGTLMVGLVQGGNGTFCERPRLKPRKDWHREPAIATTRGRRFSWRRFLHSEALMIAVVNFKTEVTKHLIQSDVCNVNAIDRQGWTALICASVFENTDAVKLILQKDCSSIDFQIVQDKRTALLCACQYGYAAVIELLIRSGANVDLKDEDNKTTFQILDERGGRLSQEEKTRLKDLPRLIRQEQLQKQHQN